MGSDGTRLGDGGPAERLAMTEVYLVPTGDGGLTMRSPRRSAVLRGKLVTEIFPRMLPLLDGTRTRAELVDELSDVVAPRALEGALDRLSSLGFIEDVAPVEANGMSEQARRRLEGQRRFFTQYGGDAGTVNAIAQAHVLIAGEGPLVPAIALALAGNGVAALTVATPRPVTEADLYQSPQLRDADVGEPIGSAVRRLVEEAGLGTEVHVTTDFPESVTDWRAQLSGKDVAAVAIDAPVVALPWLEDFNKAALATSTSWTSGALLQRASVHVGPSVIPHQTACWKCFEHRLKSNLDSVVRYEEFQDYVAGLSQYQDQGSVPEIASFTGSLVAFEAVRLIGSDRLYVQTAGTLLSIDVWEYRMDNHPVLKLPRCPHCSPTHLVPQERVWS